MGSGALGGSQEHVGAEFEQDVFQLAAGRIFFRHQIAGHVRLRGLQSEPELYTRTPSFLVNAGGWP